MILGIIGSGNVASVLARSFRKGGHHIAYVCSRNEKTGMKLAKQFNAPFLDIKVKLPDTADLNVIATDDSSIDEVVKQIKHLKKPVVHTSGATPLTILKKFKTHGVVYPVNSISSDDKYITPGTFFCIETSSPAFTKKLKQYIIDLKCKPVVLNSDERLAVHVAAVFSNNFVNALLQSSYEIVTAKNISFEILMPLLHTTINKAWENEPAKIQTGPAIRNDELTLNKHLLFLKGNEELKKIYYELTSLILHQQAQNK